MAGYLRGQLGNDITRHIQKWSRAKRADDYECVMWWSDLALVMENNNHSKTDLQHATRRWPWSRTLTKIRQSDRYLLVLGHVISSSARWHVVACTTDRYGVVYGVHMTTLSNNHADLTACLTDTRDDTAVATLRAPSKDAYTPATVCREQDLNPDERQRWIAMRQHIGGCVPRVVDMYMRGDITLFEIHIILQTPDPPPQQHGSARSLRM